MNATFAPGGGGLQSDPALELVQEDCEIWKLVGVRDHSVDLLLLLADAVERHEVSLDDPVPKYLPAANTSKRRN